MRVALTGASGFIGKRLARRLVDQGMTVRALQHSGMVKNGPGMEVVQGSLEDKQVAATLVEGVDAVIHCGGVVAARSPHIFHRINAEGTRLLAEATLKAGAKPFFLLSSLAAREPHLSVYAASKYQAELALHSLPGLQWDALRPPAVYGPGDKQILKLIKLLHFRLMVLPAGAEGRLSVIHVDDVVEAILAWLLQGKTEQRCYELDDGHSGGYRWMEVMTMAASAMKVRARPIQPSRSLLMTFGRVCEWWAELCNGVPLLSRDKVRELRHADWVADSTPFRQRTGWQPAISLSDGLAQTIAWYKEAGWL